MPSTLSIDISALRFNYNLLRARHAKNSIAAVVKANAYGLGVETVSKIFWEEGCRDFFVATLEEGLELRGILPEANIGVFQGLFAGEEKEYIEKRLTPVLNDLLQVERFLSCSLWKEGSPVIIHVDTGMTRLGLSHSDLVHPAMEKLAKLQTPNSKLIISHLACANDAKHPKNQEQLIRFKEALKYFPEAKASLSNSAGLYLSDEFHFDIGRPGCALYGINPADGANNPMQHVATLSTPIISIRTLDRDETIGYGATASANKNARIAILGIGYADGYMRLLSNQGYAYIAGYKVRITGRVSMDMIEVDISEIPLEKITYDTRAELISSQLTVDDIAKQCSTIGYEIFTRLGKRVKRKYI